MAPCSFPRKICHSSHIYCLLYMPSVILSCCQSLLCRTSRYSRQTVVRCSSYPHDGSSRCGTSHIPFSTVFTRPFYTTHNTSESLIFARYSTRRRSFAWSGRQQRSTLSHDTVTRSPSDSQAFLSKPSAMSLPSPRQSLYPTISLRTFCPLLVFPRNLPQLFVQIHSSRSAPMLMLVHRFRFLKLRCTSGRMGFSGRAGLGGARSRTVLPERYS